MDSVQQKVSEMEKWMKEIAYAQLQNQLSIKDLSDEIRIFQNEMKDFKNEMNNN